MSSPLADTEAVQLLRSWATPDSTTPADDAREAMWEYWRRVADEVIAFDEQLFELMLSADIPGQGEIVAELLRKKQLPMERLPSARVALMRLGEADRDWALKQLNAAEALAALSERQAWSGLIADALTQKGVSWAALEAIDDLSEPQAAYLLAVARLRGDFTRAQVARLREAFAQRFGHAAPSSP